MEPPDSAGSKFSIREGAYDTSPDLADVQLPMGCKYLVLDKNYQVTETTLEGDELDRAMEYAISGKIIQTSTNSICL